MIRYLTCIMCPAGCELEVQMDRVNGQDEIVVRGNSCKRGVAYGHQEVVAPMRSISTSVLVEQGELPLASVRLTKPIPKAMIVTVMEEIKAVIVAAPVQIGDIVITDVCGTGSDVIITKNVKRQG